MADRSCRTGLLVIVLWQKRRSAASSIAPIAPNGPTRLVLAGEELKTVHVAIELFQPGVSHIRLYCIATALRFDHRGQIFRGENFADGTNLLDKAKRMLRLIV